ncbi:hypothetical protein [Egicoccus halophilus]|uniref:Uncharacterized protein n=1 Tax=Egicoccus halophilus TaxID=1670830 RepID=A0A8J3A6R1_9ACTN|nr:hypothetical protein [Egicoccus halophilus]GGI04917.1 hypothetical protein GCM10011354_11490 [Egicoccus halophilus]
MNRRASLPGADELFRSTADPDERTDRSGAPARSRPSAAPAGSEAESPEASGRVRHDQKITVYLTAQELVDLEQARLRLRAEFGIAVDRGRIVREAVAELLQELHDHGPDAAVVHRLS